jgi:acyl-CoA thioester hydrolase
MTSDKVSRISIQLRYRDIDTLGHVNNAVYLSYFEMGRIDFFRKFTGSFDEGKVDFVIAHASIDFKKPIRLQDSPLLETRLKKVGNSSFTFFHRIISESTQEEFCTGETVAVTVDGNGRKKPVPDEIRSLSS